jgi:hypothetical protein
MKALPKKWVEVWQKAKCDPEGKLEFLIKPLINIQQTHIYASNAVELGKSKVDIASVSYDNVAFALKGIRGYFDPETNKPIELEYEEVDMGGRTFKRVTDDFIDRMPQLLFNEILNRTSEAIALTPEDVKDVGFTPPSPTDNSSAPETSQPAGVDADSSP